MPSLCQYASAIIFLVANTTQTWAQASACDPASMYHTQIYSAGNAPREFVVIDLNQDGLTDLAVTNLAGDSVSILISLGDGNLEDPVIIDVQNGPKAIVAGDINEDGNPDLIVTNVLSNSFSVLIGNGDGSFQQPIHNQTGSAPVDLEIEDFDGDSHLDLLIVSRGDDAINVYLGNGDGSFQLADTLPVTNVPLDSAIGDFNQDGLFDLAVVYRFDSLVEVFLGMPNGSFTSTQVIDGFGSISVESADFNQDGIPDLVVLGDQSKSFNMLEGTGDGTFSLRTPVETGTGTKAVRFGDLNHDAVLEMTVLNYNSETINIYEQDDSNGYEFLRSYQSGVDPYDFHIGDFDNDGHPDFVVSNTQLDSVKVLAGRGDNTFSANSKYPYGTRTLLAYINSDNILDFMVMPSGTIDHNIYFGNGDGSFRYAATFLPPSNTMDRPNFIDINGDEITDLVYVVPGLDIVNIMTGDGLGQFVLTDSAQLPFQPRGLYVHDIDADGDQDFVLYDSTFDCIYIFLNDGSGMIEQEQQICPDIHINRLALLDTDDDGVDNIVYTTNDQEAISIHYNPDGTFTENTLIDFGIYPGHFDTADFNNDGLTDISFSVNLLDQYAISLNLGNNTFAPPSVVPLFFSSGSFIMAEDLDSDGNMDILFDDNHSNTIHWLRGNGDGTLNEAEVFYIASVDLGFPFSIGDLDSDGDMDLLLLNRTDVTIDVMLSSCSGTAFCLADWNSDGSLNFFDVSLFITQFIAQTHVADITGDGRWDFFDVSTFLQAFAAGCP